MMSIQCRRIRGENFKHCDALPDGATIRMQAPHRYINHSCEPNVFVYSADRQRFVLAMREVAPGEELVIDYTTHGIGGKVWQCRCSRHECDFFALSPQRQLEYLPLLDPSFARVHEVRMLALLYTNNATGA